MTLGINISDLATRVATKSKALNTLINGNAADLSALTTSAKTDLVSAINELVASVSGAGATIDDTGSSTSSVWSSSKTTSAISVATAALVASAPAALDTLKELADALGDDADFSATITGLIGAKYTKPSTGIPKTDLVTTVQTSLGKADTALQSAPVTSVAGRTGVVTLAKGDVGLGSVDNTSDSAKPISSATATALAAKGTSNLVIGTTLGTAQDASLIGDPTTDFVSIFEAGL